MNDEIEDYLREIEHSLETLSERSELTIMKIIEEIEDSIQGIRNEILYENDKEAIANASRWRSL